MLGYADPATPRNWEDQHMPFDGLASTYTRQSFSHQPLDAVLAALGIEPVPDAVLQTHKTLELAKHPPSFFYGRRSLWVSLYMLSMLGTVVVPQIGIALHSSLVVHWAMQVYVTVSFGAMVKLTMFTKIREPARWVEEIQLKPRRRWAGNNAISPKPIQRLVDQVYEADPYVRFVVGTLYQKTTMLDPYLCVEKFDYATGKWASACLGVWDGDTISHLAGQRRD
jgi:hypothetical protein